MGKMNPYELITQLHYQLKVVSSVSPHPLPTFHAQIISMQISDIIAFLQ